MRAYSIFDDFTTDAIKTLEDAGIELTVHPLGVPRPDHDQMKMILEQYDAVIIGTSQKITEDMFENISKPRIIGTASVGLDHIKVPESKKNLFTILNTPNANTQSVAEYNVGAMLMTRKRLMEGNYLYSQGLDNKKLVRKPEDICGATIGFVGAGRISAETMKMLSVFGTKFLCYTLHPEKHNNFADKYNLKFVTLNELAQQSDIISINVPLNESTQNLINTDIISEMKENCIVVSVARDKVIDIVALIEKAKTNPNFYAILDLDVIPDYIGKNNSRNIVITPHIAGGTIETRKRMFNEIAQAISQHIISN